MHVPGSATDTVLPAACAPLAVVGSVRTSVLLRSLESFCDAVKHRGGLILSVYKPQQKKKGSEAPLTASECLSRIWVTVWASLPWHGRVRAGCVRVC